MALGDMYTGVPTASRSGYPRRGSTQAEVEQRDGLVVTSVRHFSRGAAPGLWARSSASISCDAPRARISWTGFAMMSLHRVDVEVTWPHPVDERHPFDQLHREVPIAFVGMELVQRDEIGMHDIGKRAKLALEAIQVSPRRLAE